LTTNPCATLSGLNHPNIVRVLDFHEDEKGLYIIMEFVEGISLDEMIRTKTGPIPEEKAFKIFKKILEGFQYAHSRRPAIIHRDIKPSNIIIGEDDEPKIIDFGIVKIVDDSGAGISSQTVAGTKIGTTLYMSPEQILAKEVDARSDIFSLGITLFVMLTGRSPFGNTNSDFEIQNSIVNNPLPRAKDIYPGVSDKAQKIIDKATEKRKENRFQNCNEFKEALFAKEEIIIPPFESGPLDGATTFDAAPSLDAATTFDPSSSQVVVDKYAKKVPEVKVKPAKSFDKQKKSKAPLILASIFIIAAAAFSVWYFVLKDSKPVNPIVAKNDSIQKVDSNKSPLVISADSNLTKDQKKVDTTKKTEEPKKKIEPVVIPVKEVKKEDKKVEPPKVEHPKVTTKPIDQSLVMRGGRLSQERCASCHNTMGSSRIIGPGWKGITKKRSEAWLLSYMTNPKDDISNLTADDLKRMCFVQLPRRSLDYQEAKNVIEFMRNTDQ
jgi:serine/threonine protein kinase